LYYVARIIVKKKRVWPNFFGDQRLLGLYFLEKGWTLFNYYWVKSATLQPI
jgi:hypothetical protein